MNTFRRFFPGFKVTCITACITCLLLSGSLFAKGLIKGMTGSGFHDHMPASPQYCHVHSNMIVIALLTGLLGLYCRDAGLQRRISVLLFFTHAYYACLDFMNPGSLPANSLYRGSVLPALASLLFAILFLGLSLSLSSAPKYKAVKI